MPGLHIQDVSVRFGAVTAVDDLTLSVPRGTTMALLGPSGCGKSTLLRVVAGLQRASQGTVSFDGRVLDAVPPHQRGIGLMFQSHALFPHRNVGDNVGFGLKMAGIPTEQRRERAAEMLAMVGLEGFAKRSVDTLSGGQAQRVALARALAPSPQLLLLDEPLGSLDRILRERLAEELRALLTQLEQTAIHVTHDHYEAATVADEVAVMDKGRLLQSGRIEELREHPGSPVVAQLLGL